MTGTALSTDDKAAFDFDDHRWRRYLVAFARIEETLQQAETVWNSETNAMRPFIEAFNAKAPASYFGSKPQWRTQVFLRFDALMKMAGDWKGEALRDVHEDNIPRPRTAMRITPMT